MSYEVQDWISALSEQRNKKTGCIPWSYEWMLRYKNAAHVNFCTFQDDFDLAAKGKGANNFLTIASKISYKYPSVEFKCEAFQQGNAFKKIQELEKKVTGGILCAYSLAMVFNGHYHSCHIMPVVALDKDHVTMVYKFHKGTSKAVLFKLPKNYLAHVHSLYQHGRDFAWIERC